MILSKINEKILVANLPNSDHSWVFTAQSEEKNKLQTQRNVITKRQCQNESFK